MEFFSKLFKPAAVPQVDAAGANARRGQTLILDVRQPEEFRQARIPGARLLPLGELSRRIQELPKDREIVVVCRSGNRSGQAARQLSEAGYKVANLRGGMIAWEQAGLPVQRGGR
jgi:rhodanese-related sulfurtransferase